MKQLIKGFKCHYIDECGNVYSFRNEKYNKLKTYYDSKSRYECIVISEDGVRTHCLIHRLVAKAFIPNVNNYNEINHIDNNPHNNNVNNLEWCSRKYNLEQSYKTLSPTRNYVKCELYKNNEHIKTFNGIVPAAKYASEHFNVSSSSLCKYKHSGDVSIKLIKV